MNTELEKGLSNIISEARYNSQWTNVVDMEIAKKSYELGCFESESTNAIKFVSWLCNTKNIYNILEMKITEVEMYKLYKQSLSGMSEIPTNH